MQLPLRNRTEEDAVHDINRRDFLKLAGLGGAVFASGLAGCSTMGGKMAQEDFYFVQLSDAHWGFNGPVVNPDAKGTLPKAVAAVNALRDAAGFHRVHRRSDAHHRRSEGAQAAPGGVQARSSAR